MKLSLADLAKMTGGELEGDSARVVTGAAGLADAGENDVSFLGNPKYAAQVRSSKAGCVFMPRAAKGAPKEGSADRIYVDDPQWAFAQVLAQLEEDSRKASVPLLHAKADIHYEARLSPNVSVGPFSIVERKASIGEGTVIASQCFIGANARIGKNCLLYPRVVVRENCVVGDRAILHAGAVIGADGFGFSTDPKTGRHRKIPQIGNVVLEEDVEVGANTTIDRATVGTTRVGAGTKIDNLVQIAHNVTIGKNCLIVSQTGIAGSTNIGNQVVLAGQSGIAGHLAIGDGAIITAQTGVMSDVEPKSILFGTPARPHREAMKLQALLGRLPDMYETFKGLKQERENANR